MATGWPANKHKNRLQLPIDIQNESRELRTLQAERAEAAAQLYRMERGQARQKAEEARQKRDALQAQLDQLREEWRELDNEVHHHDRHINALATREWDFQHEATRLRQSLEASS